MSARRAGLSSGMSEEAVGLLDEVTELMPPSNVSIKELMFAGSNRTAQQALLNAEFLRAENIARSADMLKQLHTMPPLLGSHQMVQDLAAVYQMRLTQALGSPPVKTPAEEEVFATNLRESRARDGETRFAFGVALSELYSRDGGISQRDQLQIDWHLDALFSSRVGLRFLVEHYLASRSPRDGWSGIIQLDCSPSAVCEEAASAAKCRTRRLLGRAPEIIVHADADAKFTFVPEQLSFVVGELINNAAAWTVRQHERRADIVEELPPVRVVVVVSDTDVTIKVADEGGGLPRSKLADIWSYKGGYWQDVVSSASRGRGSIFEWQGVEPGRGSMGLGLPLSRIHAKYFGGTLHVTPMEGYGTDCYARFNRLAHENTENFIRAAAPSRGADGVSHDLGTWERGAPINLYDAQGRRLYTKLGGT